MNLQNLKYAYEILDNVFEKNIAFSLGGYHSLVKQNILEEFRPINDIDVNIIIDSIATTEDLIQDRIINCFNDFSTFGRISRKDYVLKLNTEPERDYYKKKVKQDKKDSEVESDVCFSISLTVERVENYLARPRKTYTKAIPDNPLVYWPLDIEPTRYYQSDLVGDPRQMGENIRTGLRDQTISGTTPFYGFTDMYTTGFYTPSFDTTTPSPPFTSTQKSQENKDPRVFIPTNAFNDFIKRQIFDKLVDLVLCNNNELTIDFFLMEHDAKHTQISVIDEENYTAYYPILKAKYRYCTEKFTPEGSFKKHIHDLSLSFNTKRIRGLNYPEDIELLIKNWEEMHEKDK